LTGSPPPKKKNRKQAEKNYKSDLNENLKVRIDIKPNQAFLTWKILPITKQADLTEN